MNQPRKYVLDLLERISMIERFTQDGRDAFSNSEITQEAVIRCYEVIGEIVKRLDVSLLTTHDEIPWKQIIGFRDFLIHNYEKVKVEIIWEAVENDLPVLRKAVEAILADFPDE